VLQQNTNAAVSSLVMCYFSAYATIPAAVFKMNPNGFLYGAVMSLLGRAGPLLRLALRSKTGIKVMWYEKLLSAVLGRDLGLGDMNELGERVFNLERMYNLREGVGTEEDRLPERLLKESTFPGRVGGVPLGEMLPAYYRLRGWDERGVPRPETLERLKIKL